jgi:23S rRNA (uracil1939-C5)-methyltransferase
LRAVNGGGRPLIGFREAGSHRVVDMKENFILVPEIIALLDPLRALLGQRKDRYAAEIELTLADQGIDCGIKGLAFEGFEAMETLNDFARGNALARLTLDLGYGAEAVWEPEPVTVTFGGVPVPFPSGAFLQATADGEAALVSAALEWIGEAGQVADLFAGLGTFAFALARQGAKVAANEAARDAVLAVRGAAGRARAAVEGMHRDLFRNPLQPDELAKFGAVLLDPPRAGAREQVGALAQSAVHRIAYVSCNPSSWARDAKTLVEGGYRLAELRPVGQFRWSTHVELASLFIR